jgi:prepilin-type N-terminal cleavage/methylation domain-containing protein
MTKKINNLQFTIYNSAFTLIELLVVISIIGILVGLSVFGFQGARKTSRDAVRKADLEEIRSGLGMYKADCNAYPLTLDLSSSIALKGDGSSSSCLATNIYVSATPVDPTSPNAAYIYNSDGVAYSICAALEQGGTSVSCGGSGNCGGATCNYKVTSP